MDRNIQQIIKEMTIEEKASICSGFDYWNLKEVPRLNIPSIMVADGPHGLRKQEEKVDHIGRFKSVPSTCFPSAAGLASSWNRELVENVGKHIGKECQAENVSIVLGPGANIKRSPLCGRNFEYFSEDPFLSSELAVSHINGVQGQNVGTSLKHFAVNNQEYRRMSIDAIVDERTLREIYLASFEKAVTTSKPWSVMSAYNRINGAFASESKKLLTDILREEWGFEGIVVTDWGAMDERVTALESGLDLEMPSSHGIGDNKIIEAINGGQLSMEVLNGAVERILKVVFKAVDSKIKNATYDKLAHHHFARVAAAESMVLLKNEEEILPLKKTDKIGVIGELVQTPRYQGNGSSRINPTYIDDMLSEIEKATSGTSVFYEQGYELANNHINKQLMEDAQQLAIQSDVAVIFAGLPDSYESEGYDRKHLHIPHNQQVLIDAVAEVQPNVVVVLSNGGPIEMPWLDKVKGILECYLGGQAFGGAIADLLFGDVNPSGKLAETFPEKLNHNPSYLNFPGEGDRVEYREGLFVGYRYYDTKEIEPLFPFGFGLSYTTFEYANLEINKESIRDTETVDVMFTVKNTGKIAGKEVIQLYVRDVESSVIRPEKELKGFEKINLQPNEEKTVTFTLDKRAFAFYNVDMEDWYAETGKYDILVGSSSKSLPLKGSINVVSTTDPIIDIDRNTTFGDLLNHPKTSEVMQNNLEEIIKGSPFDQVPKNPTGLAMVKAMTESMPLRAMITFNPGNFTEDNLTELLAQLRNSLTK